MQKRFFVHVIAVVLLAAFLGGCVRTEELSGNDAALVTGGIIFTDQEILNQITLQVLRDAGVPVIDGGHTGNSTYTRGRLETGEIDLFWSTPNVIWQTTFGQEPIPNISPQELHELVRDMDAENDIIWLDMADSRGSLGLTMTRELSAALNIRTISDLAAYLSQDELTLVSTVGFTERPDGLPGLREVYGLDFGENIITVVGDDTYSALLDGEAQVGMSSITDWRMVYHDFVILEDDLSFFVPNTVAPAIRREALERFPEVEEILAPVAARINNEMLVNLGFEVNSEGRTPEEVTAEWLRAEGLVD